MFSSLLSWISSYPGLVAVVSILSGLIILSVSAIIIFLLVRRLRKEKIRSDLSSNTASHLYAALFKDNHQILIIVDPESGEIVDVNKAACDFYGYSSEEFIGINIKEINTLSQTEIHIKMQEAFDLNKTFFHFKHRLANGTIRDVEVCSGKILLNGRDLLYSAINDISEKIKVEKELVSALDQAKSSSRSKSEFLANMSHEIRTPLNGAMGMLQLLGISDIDSEQSEYVDAAYRSCKNLMCLLSELLDLSKIEAGKVEIVREEFSLSDILRDVESNFSVAAADKGLNMSVNISSSIPETVFGDPLRVRQILFNLVGNSVKFTETGYVMVDVYELSGNDPNVSRILVSIQDSGIGIPDDIVGEVFEAFTQGENSYSRKIEGAGLGMQIVKRLIELMDGSLAIETEEGVGTTFMLRFDVGIGENSKRESDQLLLSENKPEKCSKILVVEDDPVNMKVLSTMLRKSGLTVETAINGRIAVQMLAQSHFDLVLMDVQMPEMDGVSATRIIRNSPKFAAISDIPIVALTAYVMSGDKEKFVSAGMDDYISKPVDYNILMDKVSKYCSHD